MRLDKALAFQAYGHPIPRSVKQDITVEEILACPTSSHVQVVRFRQLRDLALRNGVNAPWVDSISLKLQAIAASPAHPSIPKRRRSGSQPVKVTVPAPLAAAPR